MTSRWTATFSGHGVEDGIARSIWPSIYQKVVEEIRAHRSTLIFVNARRSAERLAAAINAVAEEDCRAHHGSLAHSVRADIEDLLKRGELPAIVATASLELGEHGSHRSSHSSRRTSICGGWAAADWTSAAPRWGRS